MRQLVPFLLPACCLILLLVVTPRHYGAVPQPQDDSTLASEVTADTATESDASPVLIDRDNTAEDSTGQLTGGRQVSAAADPQPTSPRLVSAPMLLTGYCALIVAGSLFGGWLPSLLTLTHTRMQTIVSFVGGLMLGIAVFHLIPHASRQLRDLDTTMMWMMAGILLMFFLIRTFHFHNHGIAEDSADDDACDPCAQDHAHTHSHIHAHPQAHQLSWIGIVTGLSIHTLLDGIALGSAVKIDFMASAVLPGVAVFIVILLHKPLDAVSITSLMVAGGWDGKKILAVNAGFAMMCPLGAALLMLGADRFPGIQQELAGSAMAFSAGVFLCIALSDLLPEMEFHSHHRLRLSAALAIGIATAWGMTLLESALAHG